MVRLADRLDMTIDVYRGRKTTMRQSRIAVVNYWLNYMHLVMYDCLGGLSMPRNSVVRLTDHPDMTVTVYHGCISDKTITTHMLQLYVFCMIRGVVGWCDGAG